MANSSIFAAFERMWQHVVAALGNKSDVSHNHNENYDIKGAAEEALTSANSYTDTKTANLASNSAVDTKISTHNTNTEAHNDIRALIDGLTTRLNALANSTDEDLDQMAEVVAYIKSNKELIEAITTGKVSVDDIIDNLTTNVSNKPLSAAQGVALKALIDGITASSIGALPTSGGTITGTIDASGTTNPMDFGTSGFIRGSTTSGNKFDIFGYASPTNLQIGGTYPALSLKGQNERPTYNDNNMALLSDVETKANIDHTHDDKISLNGFVTADDIDTICGTSIVAASEVEY